MTAEEILEGTRVATAHMAGLATALKELGSKDGPGEDPAVPMGTQKSAAPSEIVEPDPAAFANVERLGEFRPAALIIFKRLGTPQNILDIKILCGITSYKRNLHCGVDLPFGVHP